jgi:hypothetical protein
VRQRPGTIGTKGAINVTDGSNYRTSERFKNQDGNAVKREDNKQLALQPEDGFFLTGVNVQNQDIQGYVVMEQQSPLEEGPVSDQEGLDLFA